jgi:hypothetical protein
MGYFSVEQYGVHNGVLIVFCVLMDELRVDRYVRTDQTSPFSRRPARHSNHERNKNEPKNKKPKHIMIYHDAS